MRSDKEPGMVRKPADRWLPCLLLALVPGCIGTGVSTEDDLPGTAACLTTPDTIGYLSVGLRQPTSMSALEDELSPSGPGDIRPTKAAMTPVRLLRVASADHPGPPDPPEFDVLVRGGVTEPVIGPIVQFSAQERPALIVGNTLVLTVGSRLYLDRAWWYEDCDVPYRLTFLDEGIEVVPR